MDYPKVDSKVCTGCGICVDSCPMEAITLINDIATIDINKCSNCRACVNDCPNEAIS
jgi:ferredoxin